MGRREQEQEYCNSCDSGYGLANNYPGPGEKSCVRTCASVCDDIVGGVYYVRNGEELCKTSNFAHSDDANKCRDYCCDRGCKWPAAGNYNRARISVNNVNGDAPTDAQWQHWLWNIRGNSEWVAGSPKATCAAGFDDQPGFAGGAKKLKCVPGQPLELGGCVMRCTHPDIFCPPGSFKYSATDNRLCGGMICARDGSWKLINNDYETCCYSCVCSYGTRDNSNSCPGKNKQFCSSSCDSGYGLRGGYPNGGEKSCFPECSSVDCATKSPVGALGGYYQAKIGRDWCGSWTYDEADCLDVCCQEVCRKPSGSNLLGYGHLDWPAILRLSQFYPNTNMGWQTQAGWVCDSGYHPAPGSSNVVEIRCLGAGQEAKVKGCAPTCECSNGIATQSNCPGSRAQWCASCNTNYAIRDDWPDDGEKGCYPSCSSVTCTTLHEESSSTSAAEVSAASPFSPMTAAGEKRRLMNRGQSLASLSNLSAQAARRAKRGAGFKKGDARRKSAFARLSNSTEAPADAVHRSARTSTQDAAEDNLSHISDYEFLDKTADEKPDDEEDEAGAFEFLQTGSVSLTHQSRKQSSSTKYFQAKAGAKYCSSATHNRQNCINACCQEVCGLPDATDMNLGYANIDWAAALTSTQLNPTVPGVATSWQTNSNWQCDAWYHGGPELKCPGVGKPALVKGCAPTCDCTYGSAKQLNCPFSRAQFCTSCTAKYGVRTGYPAGTQEACFPLCSSVDCTKKSDSAGAFHQAKVNPNQRFCDGPQAYSESRCLDTCCDRGCAKPSGTQLLGYADLDWSQILTSPALNPSANTNWQSDGTWQCDSGYSGAPQIRCGGAGSVAGARNCAPICDCDHGTATQASCPFSGAQFCQSCTSTHTSAYKTRTDYPSPGEKMCYPKCKLSDCAPLSGVHYIQNTETFCGDTKSTAFYTWSASTCRAKCCSEGCKEPTVADKVGYDANIDYAALLSSTDLEPSPDWKQVSGHGFSCDATYVGKPRIKCANAGHRAQLDVSYDGCYTCVCEHGTHTNIDCPGHLKQFCDSCEDNQKYGLRSNSPAAGQVSCYPQCSSITCTQWSLTTSTQSYYQLAYGAEWCGKWDWDETNCFDTCCEEGCRKPADGSSALVGYNQLNFKAALEDPLMNPVHPTHGGNWHSKSSWSCDPWYHGTAELKCSTAGQSVQLRGCMPTCLCWKGTPAQTNCPFSTAQFCQSCADPQRDGILVDAGSGQKRCWAQCSNITCHYKNANNAWYQNSIPSVSFCTGQNDTDAQCKNVCCEEGCREPSADAQVGYVIPSWEKALTKTKMYPGGSFQEDSDWSCAFQYHGTAKLRCTGSGNAALIDYSSKKVHC